MGPARQAGTHDTKRVWQLDVPDASPLVPHGPFGAKNLAVDGSRFFLREIEAALGLAINVHIDEGRRLVIRRLAASKTDPCALSVTREWGCTCSDDVTQPCAYHAARKQLAMLKERFGDECGALPEGLPFYPTSEGDVCTKEAVVRTLRRLAELSGDPLLDEWGRELITGHSLRVTAARELSAMGVESRCTS